MKRILTILSLCILCCTLPAQTNKQGGRPRAAQTQQATKKKQQTTRKAKATPQKQGAGKKRGTQQKQQKQQKQYSNASIKGLQQQRAQIQKKIKEQ